MNDLIDGPCKAVTLIYARATLSHGNIGGLGQTLVKTLFDHLGKDKLAVQGVSAPAYNATEASAVSKKLKAPGAAEMARLANKAMEKCPRTKLVLSGYSQGAMVRLFTLLILPDIWELRFAHSAFSMRISACNSCISPLVHRKYTNVVPGRSHISPPTILRRTTQK